MLHLKQNPSLLDYQEYISHIEKVRGFDGQSSKDKCLLLGEEIGELFKAIRKKEGLKVDEQSQIVEIGCELADVFSYVCSIANYFNINLEDEFRNKEEKNKDRSWK